MNYNNFSNPSQSSGRQWDTSYAFPMLMRKVYTWMTMALIITGVTAYGVSETPALLSLLFSSRLPMMLLIFAEFGLVFFLSSRIHKLSLSTATLCFIVFSLINGATLGSIFFLYSIASIAKTFFITAGTFGAMALIGSTTKKDLTRMGGILMMALIGLIIAGVVNLFFKSTMMDLIVSGAGVLIFTGITAWDAQNIKKSLMMAPDTGETPQKIALLVALSLYLDFINLFLYLLRFFGSRRD